MDSALARFCKELNVKTAKRMTPTQRLRASVNLSKLVSEFKKAGERDRKQKRKVSRAKW